MYKSFDLSSDTFELLPKWTIFCYYFNSLRATLWIIFKWCIMLAWTTVSQYTNLTMRDTNGDYKIGERNHNKPPQCLTGTDFGLQSYVKLKSIKFHYIECGNKSDPLVLLLHGFPDCWIGWRNQIHELSNYFRVVAIDLKGFNDSEKPLSRGAYRPKQICEELLHFINSLGRTSTVIIGHDLGAIIGWMFVHLYPDHVDKFVSVSTPHPNLAWTSLLNSKAPVNDYWLKFSQMPFIPEYDLLCNGSSFLEKSLPHLYPEKSSLKTLYRVEANDQIQLDVYKYVFNRQTDWTGPLNYYRNFPFYKIKEGQIIQCPCLIISGNLDSLEPIVKSTDFCSNFLLKIIIGAGHWPHQEKPDEFNKVLLKFLVGSGMRRVRSADSVDAKVNKSLMGRMFGAVASGVKMGSMVLDSGLSRGSSLSADTK